MLLQMVNGSSTTTVLRVLPVCWRSCLHCYTKVIELFAFRLPSASLAKSRRWLGGLLHARNGWSYLRDQLSACWNDDLNAAQFGPKTKREIPKYLLFQYWVLLRDWACTWNVSGIWNIICFWNESTQCYYCLALRQWEMNRIWHLSYHGERPWLYPLTVIWFSRGY